MSYASSRTSEIIAAFDGRIGDFVKSFNPHAETVVLLPGGMGSQLDRSFKKYNNDGSLPLNPYMPVWISLGILFGDALHLEIDGADHDEGDHIIIPDGPLRFFLQEMTPYDVTERYFREAGLNFIVFGYDWRRPLAESVAYFQKFLERLSARVKAFHGVDPLESTTIVTHSMGGLVAKLFLNRIVGNDGTAADVREYCQRIISVAAPYYGTSSHILRYYIGQQPLTKIYGAKKTAQVVGSLPGPYILNFLDADAYNADAQRLELDRYPVRDADDDSLEADPYDPVNKARFPSWVSAQYLKDAKAIQKSIAKKLPAGVMKMLYNIRSGLDTRTWVEQQWGTPADPEDGTSPVAGVAGPGDGTVPYWSAKHAYTPDDNVFDLQHAFDHGQLMEHGETLEAIWRIIDTDEVPDPIATPDQVTVPPKATLDEMHQFVDRIVANDLTADDPAVANPAVWRRLIQELSI